MNDIRPLRSLLAIASPREIVQLLLHLESQSADLRRPILDRVRASREFDVVRNHLNWRRDHALPMNVEPMPAELRRGK